jgi:transposase
MRRYELTDTHWQLIEDLFPNQTMGRPRRSDRTVLNGIFWILCSGAAWRDLPERYGPWKTVYHRFRQWQASGLFDSILERLHIELDEQGLMDYSTWMIDSTSIRASRAASGAPKANAPTDSAPTKKGVHARPLDARGAV